MFSKFTRFSLVISMYIVGAKSYAGGCHLKEVTIPKSVASTWIATNLRDKLVEVEKEMKSRGQSLKAVVIARSGESLESFDIIADNPKVPLEKYLNQLADVVTKQNLTNEEGLSNTPTNQLPKDMRTNQKLAYSHLGFLIKKNPSEPQASDWIFSIDLLAECDEASDRYGASDIFFHELDQFFWDTKILDKKTANRALLAVPTPAVQERLYKLLHNAEIGNNGLHQPRYNVAATPFRLRGPKDYGKGKKDYHQLRDQNSNQWPLEMIATASQPEGQIHNREQAQDLLMKTNYRPSLLIPLGLKESAACALKKGILLPGGPVLWDATNLLNCDDQVFRRQNIYQIITVRSVLDYMIRNKLMAQNVFNPGEPAIYEVTLSQEDLRSVERTSELLEKIEESMKPKKP